MIIKPTVGRVVWYWPWESTPRDGNAPGASHHVEQPFAALVAYVHSDRMVNLVVFDHNGISFPATSVVLVQEGDSKPDGAPFCGWMPYQIGQAKKHAAD